jgi:very-short-patch-repair endonuclease
LDYLRRELAIAVPFLDLTWQEAAATRSFHQLQTGWVLPSPDGLEQASIVFCRSRPRQGRISRDWAFLSPRGSFAQWLKKKGLASSIDEEKLKTADVERVLRDLIDRLLKVGLLVPKEQLEKLTGVQVAPGALRFKAGDGLLASHDPLRMPRAPEGGRVRVNPAFVALYRSGPAAYSALEAREHTAQVANDRREEREERFRAGRLPILYCSPTMELGVDIAELDVVGLRNVPPSPANYAQRSGRAGRSGQPALVFTYCSAGSPHDQHYFRRPEKMVAGVVAAPRLDLGNEDLVRAHVHAIWLAASGLELGQSMKDVLDVSGESPSLALLEPIRQALDDARARERASTVARAALADALAAVAGKEDVGVFLGRALREVPKRFENACERWKSLYRAAHGQQLRQNRIALDASRDPKERDAATRLRQQAETQLRLLTEIDTRGNSDFYVYRYLASEGFLPGYAFPRLPLSAYIEGQRGKKGTEAYLSRPRFIAISEFGPRSLIYHEGNRYAVTRVALPMGPGDGLEKTRAAICESCGYLHPRGDDPGSDLCERCGQALPAVIPNLFRMQNVTTKRRDRISSDEEERQRLGFEIVTAVRFADRSEQGSARETHLIDESGDSLCELVHGDSATLWRINVGWRRRASREERGFFLDVERGIWAKRSPEASGAEDPEDDGPQEAMSKQVERVIPFVADARNCLLVTPSGGVGARTLISLGYALQGAVARVFQLEERELAVEVLPTIDDARTILLYEASEGGAGVLSQLVGNRDALDEVIEAALELTHFDPATGLDRGASSRGEPCEAGCYECLLSYFNQRHHQDIDRRLVQPVLLSWRSARFESSAALAPRSEHLDRLLRLTESELERRFLRFLDERGHRLPSTAQLSLPQLQVRADFAYEEELFVVFVDGPHHDDPERRRSDAEADDRLMDAGYTVLRFHHREDWAKKASQWPGIFGRATSTPPQR